MKKLVVYTFFALMSMQPSKADVPSIHGMILFGDEQTYVSHLPLFHPPHKYQFIAKVGLGGHPRSQAWQHYIDAKNQGEKLFTLVPERMDLTQLIDGSKVEFTASLYLGHFEQGGQNLGPVTVSIEEIVIAEVLE